jgi:hypothetical protein
MENMSSIFVDINSLYTLTIDIAAKMRTLFKDKTLLACLMCLVCKDRTKQS